MNIGATKLPSHFTEALDSVAHAGQRVVLERRGKGVAALVSMADLALLEKLEDQLDVSAARAALRESGEIPWPQVKAELGLRGRRKVTQPDPHKVRRKVRAKV